MKKKERKKEIWGWWGSDRQNRIVKNWKLLNLGDRYMGVYYTFPYIWGYFWKILWLKKLFQKEKRRELWLWNHDPTSATYYELCDSGRSLSSIVLGFPMCGTVIMVGRPHSLVTKCNSGRVLFVVNTWEMLTIILVLTPEMLLCCFKNLTRICVETGQDYFELRHLRNSRCKKESLIFPLFFTKARAKTPKWKMSSLYQEKSNFCHQGWEVGV